LTDSFASQPALRVTRPPAHIGHAYYKYYVFLRPERLKPGWNRDRVMAAVAAEGVPCFSGSCSEIYRERAFTDTGFGPDEALPVAKSLGETSLTFLAHPTLTDEDVLRTCHTVETVLVQATDDGWSTLTTDLASADRRKIRLGPQAMKDRDQRLPSRFQVPGSRTCVG
jgi:hypothetical protein